MRELALYGPLPLKHHYHHHGRCVFWLWYYHILHYYLDPKAASELYTFKIDPALMHQELGLGDLSANGFGPSADIGIESLKSTARDPLDVSPDGVDDESETLQRLLKLVPNHDGPERTGKPPCPLGRRALRKMSESAEMEELDSTVLDDDPSDDDLGPLPANLTERNLANFKAFPRFIKSHPFIEKQIENGELGDNPLFPLTYGDSTKWYFNIHGTNASLGPFSSPADARAYGYGKNFSRFDITDIALFFSANALVYGDAQPLDVSLRGSGESVSSPFVPTTLARRLASLDSDDPRIQIYSFYVQNYGKESVVLTLFSICALFAIGGYWRTRYRILERELNLDGKSRSSAVAIDGEQREYGEQGEHDMQDPQSASTLASTRVSMVSSIGDSITTSRSQNVCSPCGRLLAYSSLFASFVRARPALGVNLSLQMIVALVLGTSNIFPLLVSGQQPEVLIPYVTDVALRPPFQSVLSIYAVVNFVLYILCWFLFLRAWAQWGRVEWKEHY